MKILSQDLLDEVTGRLAAEFQPEQVWLFGSHAWGQPDDGSDLDLLVVIPQSDETPVRRAQRRPLDVVNLRIHPSPYQVRGEEPECPNNRWTCCRGRSTS